MNVCRLLILNAVRRILVPAVSAEIPPIRGMTTEKDPRGDKRKTNIVGARAVDSCVIKFHYLKINGFTLIEVLIALSLVLITWVGVTQWQLFILRSNQLSLNQTLAAERLFTLSVIHSFSPFNWSAWYLSWEKDNKVLLPGWKASLIDAPLYKIAKLCPLRFSERSCLEMEI